METFRNKQRIVLRRVEISFSIFITILLLGFYTYLFALADRKIVFLYGHLGAKPFDPITSGRYWMVSWIAGGFLSLFYLGFRFIVHQIWKGSNIFRKGVFGLSLLPLLTGITIITMSLGNPPLPFLLAISTALILVFGMMIGFSIVDDLFNDYKTTFQYLISSFGLVPFLIFFRVLELPEKGLITQNISITIVSLSGIGGFLWVLFSYRIFKPQKSQALNVIKGTIALGYMGLPVLHYLLATPKGMPYITSSENFFADSLVLRLVTWILLGFIILMVDQKAKRINRFFY